MTNQNLSDLNDKEFDSLLEDIIETPPLDSELSEFTPWNHSIKYILWGLGLTSFTLNIFNLNIFLPGIGYVLMFLGFRSLKNENGWFKTCYILTNIKVIFWLVSLFFNTSIYFQSIEKSTIFQVLIHTMIALTLILFIAVRNAIRSVQRNAGFQPHGGNGIVICYLIIIILGYISFTGFSVYGVMIAYVCTLRSLYKLSKELGKAGYAIKTTSVKVSDSIIKIGYTCIILTILLISYGFFNKYAMDWQQKTEASSNETITIKENLLFLGFPEEVLLDMSNEDILSCANAKEVIVDIAQHEIEEDNSTLKTVFIGVKLADEREKWKVIHYFEWVDTTNFCGTEAIQLWPTDHNDAWYVSSDFTGRVLYDYKETTYISDYYTLEKLTYQSNDFLFGESTSSDLFATFSMPSKSTRQRGYIMYECSESIDGAIIDSWFNYAHQVNQFQFPVRDAVEFSITAFGSDFSFTRIQTALQFYTHMEEAGLIE